MLSLDGERTVTTETCPDCGATYQRVVGFVLRDGGAFAIYRAGLHGHDQPTETWIDGTLDTDWEGLSQTDRVSFGCRIGIFDGQVEPAAALVTAGLAYTEPGTFGTRLTREDALAHPRLAEFWELVDWVLVEDPDVHEHVYRRT